jgi:hypothetical protein
MVMCLIGPLIGVLDAEEKVSGVGVSSVESAA